MQIIYTNSSWTALANTSSVAFQNVGAHPVEIGLGTDETSPTVGFQYLPGFGDRGALTVIFPGTTGNTIWGRSSANSAIAVS